MKIDEILIIGLPVFELLVRAIPTKKNFSVVHNVLNILVFVSEILNNKKTENKNPKAFVLIGLVLTMLFLSSCSVFHNHKADCQSQKSVNVVLNYNDSIYKTVSVPYCDTVRVRKIKQVKQ